MKILFLCKTPYQVLASTRIVYQQYQKDAVDLILFDTIANVDILQKNIKSANIFDSVYIYNCRDIYALKRLRKRIAYIMPLPKFPANGKYDIIFFANVYDWIENRIIEQLREVNPKLALYMYEDGFASYSSHYEEFFNLLQKASFKTKKLFSEYQETAGFFVFSPELMTWKPDCEILPIKKIEADETSFRDAINKIFGYGNISDLYEQKYIFFEESYYADGIDVNDLSVVDMIAGQVGKENILVKIHPRNKVNRFKEKGYITNTNTEVPWEVIALNIDLSEKILITIASGSALTSLINMSSAPKKIVMLMQYEKIDYNSLTPTRDLLLHIAKTRSECVELPKSFYEVKNILLEENRNDYSSNNASET